MSLVHQPCSAERIQDGSAEYHAEKAHIDLVEKAVNEKAADQRHKKIADDITAGRTEQLGGAGGKA